MCVCLCVSVLCMRMCVYVVCVCVWMRVCGWVGAVGMCVCVFVTRYTFSKLHILFLGGNPPASLFEITFDGFGNIDYYDISLVDGYNLPIRVDVMQGTYE